MRISRSRSTSPRRARSSAMAAAIASALACTTPGPAAADELIAQLTAAATARQVAVLDSVVNGQPQGPVFALVERSETVAIEASALRRWRVRIPDNAAFEFEDRLFVTVADLPGLRANIEQPTQRLLLNLPPMLFEHADIQFGAGNSLPLSTAQLAGFLNYTLFGYTSSDTSYASGFFELGASGQLGSLINTASANSVAPAGQTTNRIVRLDTAWRTDNRDGLRTWNVGDAFTQAGAWGRSVRFGGLQYGTNFQLQPNLITYPLQPFSGTAVVPSTVDVFVNGARIASQAVPPGPFTVNDVPLVSGAGDVQLVVRDPFGQQQVITQPFYASRRLLRGGLDEFQWSVGATRENYGLASFDYGSPLASGIWRRGISDRLTVETRFEADDDVRAVGATADFSVGLLGILTAGAAASDSHAGSGQLGIAGYEYQGRRFSFAARTMWATSQFRLIGDPLSLVLQRQSQASAGLNLGAMGSIGVAWAAQRYRDLPGLDTATLSYSATLPKRTFFTISVSRTYGTFPQTSAFATLTTPLDSGVSVTGEASSAKAGDQRRSYVGAAVQRPLPTDEGIGYRLRATSQEQFDAGLGYTWPFGVYTVEASSFDGSTAARATASGGLGVIGGRAFASRPITDSFGLVRIGDLEGVRVFHEGNPVGRTDQSGQIVLPRLTPYVANRITIDERDIPIDVAIRSREMRIVPQFRAGALAEYDARRRTSAILEVRLADGSYLPAGLEVRLAGSSQRYIVGHNGEIFIPDLLAASRFVAELATGRCGFDVEFTAVKNETFPKLGPFTCRPLPS
jgi:outer membrane usher protein